MAWFKKEKKDIKDKAVQVPKGLWIKCDHCGEIIYKKEIERNHNVCPKCNYHFRVLARTRLDMILDEGSFEEFDQNLSPVDILKFKDLKKYKDRIDEAQSKGGRKDAFIYGRGNVDGQKVFLGVFDFSFMGGSMGSVVGEKVTRVYENALKEKCPAIVVSSSGGARMQEGIFSLMQMAKTSAAIKKLRDAGIPYVSILTDPTTGGVTASFAMLGDIILAEPKALICFAGPRVIAETIREKLPEGFQRSEYLLEHGMVDMIVERQELKNTLSKLLDLMT